MKSNLVVFEALFGYLKSNQGSSTLCSRRPALVNAFAKEVSAYGVKP